MTEPVHAHGCDVYKALLTYWPSGLLETSAEVDRLIACMTTRWRDEWLVSLKMFCNMMTSHHFASGEERCGHGASWQRYRSCSVPILANHFAFQVPVPPLRLTRKSSGFWQVVTPCNSWWQTQDSAWQLWVIPAFAFWELGRYIAATQLYVKFF